MRWAEDWPFDLWLLTKCQGIYFLDIVFTHYRVGRQGSLLTDAKNLPKRFKALAAAQRHLAALAAAGHIDSATYAVMRDAAADVFWPQAAPPPCPMPPSAKNASNICGSCGPSTPMAPR